VQIRNQRDFVSGCMFLLVGLAFAAGALQYSMGKPARPGPGYFPLILSLLLAGLGVIVVLRSLRVHAEGGNPIGGIAWRPLAVVIGSILVFALALPTLGLLLSGPLLIVLVSLAGREFSWKGALLNSAILTAGSWVVFIWGLGLTIPVKPAFLG
jgi:hypothetical protein